MDMLPREKRRKSAPRFACGDLGLKGAAVGGGGLKNFHHYQQQKPVKAGKKQQRKQPAKPNGPSG